jgi:ribosomal protein L11 methyltransferase
VVSSKLNKNIYLQPSLLTSGAVFFMTYTAIRFNVENENQTAILVALLANAGFDGFEENETNLTAFINTDAFVETEAAAIAALVKLPYTTSFIEQQNWNAQWESSFEPVIINNFAAIRANFHQPVQNVLHEIIITPKMSFGTGHHATTFLMMEQMSLINFKSKTVLDFGTGTGVLAILAEKMGATNVFAIDNDDWSIENAVENCQQNKCTNISISKAESISGAITNDVILANINLNIISANMHAIKAAANSGATILLSGFLIADQQNIKDLLSVNNLIFMASSEKNGWLCITAVNG